MKKISEQLTEYYNEMYEIEENQTFVKVRNSIYSAMDDIKAQNPCMSAVELKSELHLQIAEHFEPVIFDELPFFYEMGIKPAECWGTLQPGLPCAWGVLPELKNANTEDEDIKAFDSFACGAVFDFDHHCLGYTKLFSMGISGILENINNEKLKIDDPQKQKFLSSAEKSCNAILKIAEKFSKKAEEMLLECDDVSKKENLIKINKVAKNIPVNPPKSFYEGLCMIWFMREVTASIEGVGISLLGRVDKFLGPLYKEDLKIGNITRDEAMNLIKKWLSITPIKFKARTSNWADSSTCIELGGCDENGDPVFNEVTKMFIEAHEELKLTIPKMNCRISQNSPKEYIDILSNSILNGHNVYALYNDSAIIEALRNNGKELIDARNYVNGGCQETMVEGAEHSAGVYLYFNMPKVLDITLNGVLCDERSYLTPKTEKYYPKQIVNPKTFDDVYNAFLNNIKNAATCAAGLRTAYGKKWHTSNPCPLFSSTLKGCIENANDYSSGGAKYNRSTFCAAGLATVIDSLYTIKSLVFDKGLITFEELCDATRNNWENNEKLRSLIISLPKYGHGNEDVDALAKRFVDDLNNHIITIPNERGEVFQLSLFAYHYFADAKFFVNATPDGRKKHDYLSQGVSPGRIAPAKNVLDAINSASATDFRKTGGINVLDINLPYNSAMTTDIVTAVIRSFAEGNTYSIQMNYVSKEQLLDAQKHPEKHLDLIVRMCGLSVYFVNLSEDDQKEFLTRNFYIA